MSPDKSRRDFIKKASLAAAAAASFPVWSPWMTFSQGATSKIVIARDPQCFVNLTVNQARVQDMVDYAIMNLSGLTDKGKAYEALFPHGVTASTKIAVLINYASGDSTTRMSVPNALRTGLTSMLGGTFPSGNVTINSGGSITNGNPSFNIEYRGSTYTFSFCDPWVTADYIINCPVLWAHDGGPGVTMSLKLWMGAVGPAPLNPLHGFTELQPSLSVLNNQTVSRDKQVLVLLNAIIGRYSGGPGGRADAGCVPCSVVASTDRVAVDYQGTLILEQCGLSPTRKSEALAVFARAAQAPYNLGTDNPDNMNVVHIQPPWSVAVTRPGELPAALKFEVMTTPNPSAREVNFKFIRPPAREVTLSIFTVQGQNIWSTNKIAENSILWPGKDNASKQVPAGTYCYQLTDGRRMVEGKIQIIK